MRALKIAGAAIGAVVVIIALLLVIGIPSGFLTGQIEARVERETGYKLAINGGAKIGLWPSLNITLNDVTLQDPKERDINNRFAAGSIQADVTLASVWAGRPHITDLVVMVEQWVEGRPIDDLNLKGFNHPILAAEILSWREEVDNVVDAAAAARRKKGS